MLKTLNAWNEMARKYGSNPMINKDYLQRAVSEGMSVMRKFNDEYPDRLDAYAHFGRVAALYTAAGLFAV